MDKAKIAEKFNPEKLGMTFCPGCSGSGRSFADNQEGNVCKACGGFGFIKKENGKGCQYDRMKPDFASDLLW